ncbi:cell division inhibition protein DicB [Escherichia coli]|nr:cell division inhibitor [Escherichia coli]EFQ9131473.1 cell division inhibitor [Escherichia coli]
METLLPNVNTSEGCFDIGVLLNNREFTEDAIKMRKYEPYLLNDNSILSRIALLELGIIGEQQ